MPPPGSSETPDAPSRGDAGTHGDDDVAGAVAHFLSGAMVPGFDLPRAVIERRKAGELRADLGGDPVRLVVLFPGVDHLVLVDIVEVQRRQDRSARRPR